jgi:hypothetical protein
MAVMQSQFYILPVGEPKMVHCYKYTIQIVYMSFCITKMHSCVGHSLTLHWLCSSLGHTIDQCENNKVEPPARMADFG